MKVLSDWDLLVQKIKQKPGKILLIGKSDSGKTSLAKYLVEKLSSKKHTISLIDSDIGQSVIGPPTTIGLAQYNRDNNNKLHARIKYLYFVGTTSPSKQMLAVLTGLFKISSAAEQEGYKYIIYDTCGLVQGSIGLELKYRKIELIQPEHIIVLEWESELDKHFLAIKKMKDIRAIKLEISKDIKKRIPFERKEYRVKQFEKYFRNKHIHNVKLSEYGLYDLDYSSQNSQINPVPGRLIGLNNNNNFTVALGIVENYKKKSKTLSFTAPIKSLDKIVSIVFSDYPVELEL